MSRDPVLHWDARGNSAPACSHYGYLLHTTTNPDLVTCLKCRKRIPRKEINHGEGHHPARP